MDASVPRGQSVVPLGYVSGVYGLQGWVKVHSWTSPRDAILDYRPWLLGENREAIDIVDGRVQGKTIIAELPGITDPEQARTLVGQEIAVPREQLPEPPEQSWYWADLVGLDVMGTDGTRLGRVERMLETGANDVMVVVGDREMLVPFVPGVYVIEVDLEAGTVVVDWQQDYLS